MKRTFSTFFVVLLSAAGCSAPELPLPESVPDSAQESSIERAPEPSPDPAPEKKATEVPPDAASIVVDPEVTRSIHGISGVDRKRYFNVSDTGREFDERMQGGEGVYEELVHNLGISFGRRLGVVEPLAKGIPEDPARPGFADLSKLTRNKPSPPSDQMLRDFGPNLDVAAHGSVNAFPAFMGRYHVEPAKHRGETEYLPENIRAAAILSAAVLKYDYSDFDRPAFYEPINEPHWAYFKDQHLADWHLATMKAVHRHTPGVKVGGPCLSISYFYRDHYKSFNGLKAFIDNTRAEMDFYSFHVYDFYQWATNDYFGRIQTGLPQEGVLDLVQNYTVNTFGKEVSIVVSESGGYNVFAKGVYDGEEQAAELAARYFPGDTFEHEMKKRSIVNALMLGSTVASTLNFMDHPHTVLKSIPFMLPNSWGWDTRYYAQLYVPYDYEDRSRWVSTDLLNFYRFFRGLKGRRVKAHCNDPDLQVRAFVDGRTLYVVINNQSYRPESAVLSGISTGKVTLRRMGRKEDFTCFYTEEAVDTPSTLTLSGREAVMLVADYETPIQEEAKVNEVSCYGDKVTVPIQEATFKVNVPLEKPVDYAELRVGLTRESGLDHNVMITLNGKVLEVPVEDCADRLDYGEYATTKIIRLDAADLKADNTVRIAFADGGAGAVGSAVIRVAYIEENPY
jgi:hypothetical protein